MGWRNDSLRGRPVEITFHFPAPREFVAVRLHLNDRVSHSAEVSSPAPTVKYLFKIAIYS